MSSQLLWFLNRHLVSGSDPRTKELHWTNLTLSSFPLNVLGQSSFAYFQETMSTVLKYLRGNPVVSNETSRNSN